MTDIKEIIRVIRNNPPITGDTPTNAIHRRIADALDILLKRVEILEDWVNEKEVHFK